MKKIEVIRKKPGQYPELIKIENSLKAMQAEVEGYIEYVTLGSELCVLCNEEGRLNDLPYNTNILGTDYFGTILIAGVESNQLDDVCMRIDDAIRMLGIGGNNK